MEKVAVIFGGVSAEHDVSIVTALNSIIKPLELAGKYEVEPIYITKKGKWYSDPKLKQISVFSSGEINSLVSKLKPIFLDIGEGLSIVKPGGLGGKKVSIDIVFPAMHGTYGENGDLMGLLEMAGIPYVGCSMSASAVAMDKILSKQMAISGGFATPRYLSATKDDIDKNLSKVVGHIKENLNYPMFVKPAHLGSSIGVARAKDDKELANALEVAASLDDNVIIEEEVANLIEVTLPIIGNEEPTPALLEKPLTASNDFFDFDTKYLRNGKGGKKGGQKGSQGYSEVPAKLDKDLYAKAEELALTIYKFFNLSGIARVDLLIDSKTKAIYFNEINPLPGSLYSHNWSKAGISNVELVTRLIDLAKARFNKLSTIQTTFDTNFLKQF
jgi:D-alanine-D-alanine ligase